MTNDEIDPRPSPDQFARALAHRAAVIAPAAASDPARWLRGWNDREGIWSNLRTIEYWIERARD